MKNFFKNIFSKKKSDQPKKSKQLDMQPIQQLYGNRIQRPMSHQKTKNYDLKNDKIPAKKNLDKNSEQKEINPLELISLNLRSNFKGFSRNDYDSKNGKFPCMITLKTEEMEEDDETRQGIDLVLLIDVSSSMSGSKIKLVNETLLFILDELDERDRVCLCKFGSNATQISGFKLMTSENKKFLKDLVHSEIYASGCTNIREAMHVAFNAMLTREEQNDSTSVFLLSDGDDTMGNTAASIRETIIENDKKMKSNNYEYQIHSFGYGEDHDEKVLSMISDTTSGNFYFIKSDKYVDECFIDCFGFLMSVIASQVRIKLTISNGFTLEDVFSVKWKKENNKEAELNLHGLAIGKTLDYITEFSFDKSQMKEFKAESNKLLATAELSFFYDDKKFNVKKELMINLVESEGERGEPDPDVEEAYAKIEGVKVMEKAKEMFDRGDSNQADLFINNYHKKLDNNKFISTNFKGKMSKTVRREYVEKEKDFLQVNKIMSENVMNPAYESFSSQNYRQKKIMSKKKAMF